MEGRKAVRQDQVTGRPMSKSIDERFLLKCGPKLASGCIEWQAHRMKTGYGSIRLGPASAGRVLAHRYAYERINGSIPSGLVVMHTCDNPACVNPEHLQIGTPKQNTADMISKGRHGWRDKTPWQKLSKADASAIKELSKQGFTQQRIADQFGVSRPLISMLINGALQYAN